MEVHIPDNCTACIKHREWCDRLAKATMDRDWDKLWNIGMKQWKQHCPMFKKHHEGNGKPKGMFAGTLTMSPNDPENEDTMVEAIKKIFKQETCPVKRYAWYVERTTNGLPHIYFIYETVSSGRIHQKVFKRYWKTWDESVKQGQGFRGGYHKVVDSETAYVEYIEKDGGRHQSNWN